MKNKSKKYCVVIQVNGLVWIYTTIKGMLLDKENGFAATLSDSKLQIGTLEKYFRTERDKHVINDPEAYVVLMNGYVIERTEILDKYAVMLKNNKLAKEPV